MAHPDETLRELPKQMGTGEPVDTVKLEKLMKERGWSRLALANAINQVAAEQDIRTPQGDVVTYSRDAVSKVLNGERHPKPATFMAMCAALECTREDLLLDNPTYGISAQAVAENLAEDTDTIDGLSDVIPSRALTEILERGYRTFADLAEADAAGDLNDIASLIDTPLDVVRLLLAKAAGYA